ncbi:MAG: heat-inducible transcription repressor HrcA [Chloroflexi bacterium]|nr:heat-inducible transcription repressor HrcA [Chloroflexota bacterium]MCH8115276.1 heat-inducible transcription repressor HrcA [Chloroflexota bacterium]MCI0775274.1 heat-inducible transcription repressor HrcA [Chloroflexota bacterium]MCI0804690.1 heat-inducible transcription repressor HrcA [Chloroflexota bacterium]MCI0808643.1 heat-inducible transcription repressor HrcA [Chloroflexota bacterium]
MPALTTRKREILKFIVSEHVQTASPVASSAIARSTNLRASPATIRNEMAALEEAGYIHRPHVSAGGVPSDRGYRQFVSSLDPDAELDPVSAALVDREFGTVEAYVEEWMDSASAVLAGLLSTLAFTTTPRTAPAPVKSVELLRLQEMLVMVIVVLQEASVYKQLITLDTSVTNSEIEHARNRLSEAIVGVPADSLAARAGRVGDGLERRAFDSAAEALRKHSTRSNVEKRFSGISKLFQQPEMIADPTMARGATWLIEDSYATAAFENAFNSDGNVNVVIGKENSEESLKNFSIVFCRYGTPETAEGTIGVMAPTRMRYGTAIPAVRYLANRLDQMTMTVYGG